MAVQMLAEKYNNKNKNDICNVTERLYSFLLDIFFILGILQKKPLQGEINLS